MAGFAFAYSAGESEPPPTPSSAKPLASAPLRESARPSQPSGSRYGSSRAICQIAVESKCERLGLG